MSTASTPGDEGAVAVVGMACRYPGAPDVRRYWQALRSGTEGITRFRREDLVRAGADPDLVRDPDYVPARGVLAGSRHFDWTYFGYSRAEAALLDPQHRVFLECAATALDDAALDPERFPGWIGVYAGSEGPTLPERTDVDPLAQMIGRRPDFLTTRAAYKLGLRGPAVTVQTACSTSLTAVHTAVQGLLAYECDAALAGGVSLTPHGEWGYLHQEGGILSPDGHCRPFDERAAGTVPGEGVGIVVLKRLEDALRDGDRIAGVLLGTALNNDGGDKIGYTAPSLSGQRDAVLLAQKTAGVDPADITYVEAHGTGTRMGDPVELQALTDAFRTATDAVGTCWIGAVKSNIGHTGSASGVAGLIKTLLMMEHGELVPTLHYRRPNPLLKLEETPFRVCAEPGPWPERNGTRIAAVSSFGVGGTNAHVVLAGSPVRTRPRPRSGAHLLALTGASPEGLEGLREELAGHFDRHPATSLAEAARTLADRPRRPRRQAVVADGAEDAARALRTAPPPAPGTLKRVAFLLPGQGTLTAAAGAAPYRLLPGFKAAFDAWTETVRDVCGVDLTPVVLPERATEGWFEDTVHQQLGLLALGHALGRSLTDLGVAPAALLGNSIGEYTAAVLAGVWTPQEAARLVHTRARAMRDTEPGRMASVSAPAAELAARLGEEHGGVEVAVAGPGRTVLSGPRAAMDALLAGDALDGLDVRLLDVGRAFHSAAMEQALPALRQAVAAVPGRAATVPVVANASGTWADPEHLRTPGHWAAQLRGTVRLEDCLGTLLADGCDTYVELGPGTSMSGALRRHPAWDPEHAAVPLLGGDATGGDRALLRALGTLWERGAPLDPAELAGEPRPSRCSLPGHPFQAREPDRPAAAGGPHSPRGSGQPYGSGQPHGPEPAGTPAPAPRRPGPRPGPSTSLRATLERLWCEALGVASAADGDDFLALGGESLMAVGLMGAVRRHTSAAVPVADFLAGPTFGRLLGLVERAADRSLPPGVVPLRRGTGRPVFLAADSLDSTGGYRTLAALTDTARPLYGLESDAPAGARVEQIAARHLTALRAVQAEGPYTLGGWSFGAVVAHEMARQLTRAGARVDVLLCLDGYAPGRGGLPAGADPAFLAAQLRLQADAVLGTGVLGAKLRRAPALRRVFLARIGALLRYRPRPVPCPAVLLKAGATPATAARLRRALTPLYPRLEVRPVAGDHWSMLAEPHARGLADALGAVLADFEPSGASGDRGTAGDE
ncbi:beta-ketoacyl synthase N-terminal-like domain-containing protein [Streptomyces sp. NPDC006134]|uniref:type I polyketide synthase n=1 Tax=Streptomyces sp. NPDC006134 TaxID=3154467 RepID=UPI003408F205